MSLYNEFFELFSEGLKGNNKGLQIGLPNTEKFLNGLHRGRYYTLFSEGGTGKSSFVWNIFVISLLDNMFKHNKTIDSDTTLTEEEKKAKRITIKVRLYSLEVMSADVIAKMICLKIYKDFGLIVSSDYILNRVENFRLSGTMQLLVQSYKLYFNKLEEQGYLKIIDNPRKPSEIKAEISKYATDNGTFYTDNEGNKRYRPNNPNEYFIIITDTVGNLMVEAVDGKTSIKGTIDAHSANCRDLYRNLLNYIPINISHSNRSMSDVTRTKLGEVFPKLSDIKETNMLEQDSSVVLTLFNPMNHIATCKALEKFMNYDITKLKESFRCLGILKNRHGGTNKRVGLLYIGECGYFEELPKSADMTNLDYGRVIGFREAMYMKEPEILSIIKSKNPDLHNKIVEKLNEKKSTK